MKMTVKKIISFLFKPKKLSIPKWVYVVTAVCFVILATGGYLSSIVNFLDSDALTLKFSDKASISVYKVIKGIFIIVGMFWITGFISNALEKYIKSIKTLKASNRAIISKTIQIFLYFAAFLVLMDMLNIDLKTLAIFSGAVGIGIGFGLQKIASNFISGLVLLFEKSVRVDDLIELENGVSGHLRYTGARYTLVETFDGKEVMIPNEDLITGGVTNWTYSDSKARLEIPVRVAYGSDLEQVQQIMLEVASAHPRCIADPAPSCFVREFDESSVNYILFFWIGDVVEGRNGPKSEVMIEIWKQFQKHGIEIPCKQSDVRIKDYRNKKPIVNAR